MLLRKHEVFCTVYALEQIWASPTVRNPPTENTTLTAILPRVRLRHNGVKPWRWLSSDINCQLIDKLSAGWLTERLNSIHRLIYTYRLMVRELRDATRLDSTQLSGNTAKHKDNVMTEQHQDNSLAVCTLQQRQQRFVDVITNRSHYPVSKHLTSSGSRCLLAGSSSSLVARRRCCVWGRLRVGDHLSMLYIRKKEVSEPDEVWIDR